MENHIGQTENASSQNGSPTPSSNLLQPPTLSLPKGGGAIRGMGEKFAANPVTGTGSMTIPIPASPGRSGFGPQLTLSYDSGAENGPFGLGWQLSLPSITRKTDKGLPQYGDAAESDVFILSGAEDLTPLLVEECGVWQRARTTQHLDGVDYQIDRYRPRIEDLFARIERWTNLSTGEIHWRSITRDNITTLYGKDNNSRIFDPADPNPAHPTRIFRWLICQSYDDKGNALIYEYKTEDSEGVDLTQTHERNRTPISRSANRYLKRIKYGNRVSRLIQPDLTQTDWLFEVVLDYGEHDTTLPQPTATQSWPCRNDPFSTYRPAFEVRTYRLCQRVLMFHHFPAEDGVGQDCLVRSLDFAYSDEQNPTDARNPILTYLLAVTQSGYKHQAAGYLKQSLPPLEFEYSQATIRPEIREVDEESLANLPNGLDGTRYEWVDLDGEGVPGILTRQGAGWFYKRNLSPLTFRNDNDGQTSAVARFAPVELLPQQPSFMSVGAAQQQFLDLAGDGRLDLVQFSRPLSGYYERTPEATWSSFVPFRSVPTLAWDDPNLRFVDLTGDGHADLLVTEDTVFLWYLSLAEDGFAAARRVAQALDEEQGPRLLLADRAQSIYLADLSGDGLTDLVRIRNGEVCYWPNLGYGRFGAKVTMDNAPWFDAPDLFDQRRIRLADIDGSGITDIIYLGQEGVAIYFNQSGNRWSEVYRLRAFPPLDNLAAITAVDLLGNGTACLVWSSPLLGDGRRSMRYIDLMGGQKPHLLVKTVNNLGAETRVAYAPSTKFYLQDKAAGQPWITRLPFPVHVVERAETLDRISRNRFVMRYTYHHGYFDGVEREFRGFGLVEQLDTEEFAALSARSDFPATNIDAASHVPPVLTRTWFHTGAFLDKERISCQFAHEYYQEGDPSANLTGLHEAQQAAMLLPDTLLPDQVRQPGQAPLPWVLTTDEIRQACRALKGSILRQEIYAQDGSEAADRPYMVSERNYTIELLQPLPNKDLAVDKDFAVFFVHPRESIEFHYERKLYPVGHKHLADPRITHQVTLAVDDYGNVLQSVAIGYGRRHPDPDPLLTPADRAQQQRTHLTYTENRYTNALDQADDYRTPLLCETRTYELLKLTPAANQPQVTNLFRFDELTAKLQALNDGQHDLPYSQWDADEAALPAPARRLIEHVRTLYRRNDLTEALPLGVLESLALPFESYKLAFTPALVTELYGDLVTDAMLADEGRYVHSAGDANWWIPAGQIFYSSSTEDAPAEELAQAWAHFFLPRRYRNPFGATTSVRHDGYDLLMQEMRDAVDNRITAGERDQAGQLLTNGNDYRVLQPRLVMDANRNRVAVAFDTLGMVVGTAVMGKPEENLGDSLQDFAADLPGSVILNHLANPLADPHTLLQQATTRLVYDLFAYWRTRHDAEAQSPVVATLARETHTADLAPDQQTKIQHSFSYSDGFGREIQKKVQAEPGPLVENGSEISPRWVGSGWTIFNNKGKPVRQYEPFFSASQRFEFGVQVGVSPVLFYDPLERVVATLHPNATWEKVVFDPWHQATWDVNDTVRRDPRADEDVGGYVTAYLANQPDWQTWYEQRADGQLDSQEQRAAQKAAAHAATPTVAYFDTLGRPFLTLANNGRDDNGRPQHYATRVQLDIEGNQRAVVDALDRVVMRYDYDLLGVRTHQASMEAGERWLLNDVAGKPIYAWDSRDHRFRTVYDALQRPTAAFLRTATDEEQLVGRTVYGETRPNPEASNLRGQTIEVFDQAGIITSDTYDFKGNLLHSQRQLAVEYKHTLDWSATVPLETPIYHSHTRYDALNRPTELTAPDNSVIRPGYNEANLLERVEANLRGAEEVTAFVTDLDYNAKGQRLLIAYGNGVQTTYQYDPLTFRLQRLATLRGAEPLQDLAYTYDPAGNITYIRDDAQQTLYFRNRRVEPSNDYTYDPLYRLIAATGREHLGQSGGQPNPPTPPDAFNRFHTGLDQPGDGNAMGRYAEQYLYDAVGNLLAMQHRGSDPAHPGWTRTYTYQEASLLEADKPSNRLSRTTIGNGPPETYTYDAHGNMTRMPHLPLMQWDYRDQLQATAQQAVNNGTPETTWYVYDAGGQRVRKVTERQAAPGETPTRKAERIYFGGGFELYHEYDGAGEVVTLERETLHIMDDMQRIALVETRTQGDDDSPARLIRFRMGNSCESACLEVDDAGRTIAYEEYYPYGSTSYQAVRSQIAPRRYRYRGQERDEENGFYYNSARYYAPWLGRWISTDPKGLVDGTNVYAYVRGNPLRYADPTGTDCDPTTQSCVDPTEPTAREEALQQSLPENERYLPPPSSSAPSESPPSPAAYDGPTIRAETEDERIRREGEGILNLDTPPGEAFDYPEAYIPYALLYGLKHNIYVPIREWISPTPRYYLDSEQHVREWTGPRDHSDALVAFAQIGTLFLPTPKVMNVDIALGETTASLTAPIVRTLESSALIEGEVASTTLGGEALYHYTTGAGRTGILESGEIWASIGAKNARHGAGQYFTDIAPEAIGGMTRAVTPPGQMSLAQLSARLFRVPWNTGKLSHFIELDVTGLGARQVAPNIYLIEGESALTIGGRVVRSGPTLP